MTTADDRPTERRSAITAAGLTRTYAGMPALEALDLDVPAGERVSLIGHNGSGKTTLLRLLAGTLEPTDGEAWITGHRAGSIEARAALSAVADRPVFYDDLSVWEHLEYVARLHDTADWEEHAAWLLDTLGVSDRAGELPTTFSRGLQQKAALAIAFVRPFEVMIVDEPFVGLDAEGRTALLELIDWAHVDGATFLVATHELSTVASADRILALRDGSLLFDGSPAVADLEALTAGHIHPES